MYEATSYRAVEVEGINQFLVCQLISAVEHIEGHESV
jgi:hypothetical protein